VVEELTMQGQIFAQKLALRQPSVEYQFCTGRRDGAGKIAQGWKNSTGRGKGPCLTDGARYAASPGVPFVDLPRREGPNVSFRAMRLG